MNLYAVELDPDAPDPDVETIHQEFRDWLAGKVPVLVLPPGYHLRVIQLPPLPAPYWRPVSVQPLIPPNQPWTITDATNR